MTTSAFIMCLRGKNAYIFFEVQIGSFSRTFSLACIYFLAFFLQTVTMLRSQPPGHKERKNKKRQTEEEVGRQFQRVDMNGLCQLNKGG